MGKYHLFLAFLFFLHSTSFSQPSYPSFSHYSINEGLPHTMVTCILQDRTGFLWFGTGNGLVKYDGYKFRVYKADVNNENMLDNDNIIGIDEDKQGNIWVNSGITLKRFDPLTGLFKTYYPNLVNKKDKLFKSFNLFVNPYDNLIYLGTDNGLLKFDPETEEFRIFDSLKFAGVNYIYADTAKYLWIIAEGLVKVEPETGSVLRYIDQQPYPVNYILNDQNDNNILWLATSMGITKVSKESGISVNYSFDLYNENYNTNTSVNCIFQDQTGKLWLGTPTNGIDIFNSRTENYEKRYQYDPYNPFSLNSNDITCFYPDNSGNLWIGTNGGGVNILSLEKKKFENYTHHPGMLNDLSNNRIGSLYESKNGVLYIGTLDGLNVLDRKTEKFSLFTYNNNGYTFGSGLVGGICEDNDGVIWATTWDGTLNRINPITRDVRIYRGGNNDLYGWSFRAILCDRDNTLWIASFDQGLEIFNRQTGKSVKFLSNNKQSLSTELYALYQGKTRYLWCSSERGIYAIDTHNNAVREWSYKFKSPQDIQSVVYSFYEESDTIIWLGTQGNGIYRMNVATGKLINYNEKHGLPSNNIYSIYPDKMNGLWMSTGNGVSNFDLKTHTFRNYDKTDGLQGNDFKWNAHFQNSNGELFFGGSNGFNIVNPDSIRDNPFLPKTVLTGFKISNQTVNRGDTINRRIILKQTIEFTKELILSYKEADISFEFAALHYASPEKNKYEYKLEGYDKQWIKPDAAKRYATYTNLPAGKYIFRVKSSNCDGLWCKPEDEVALKVIINPPFWEKWWVRVLLVFVLSISVYLWYLNRIKRLRLKNKELEDKVKERTDKIINQQEVLFNQNKELLAQKENLELFSEELKNNGEELRRTNEVLAKLNATKDRLFSIIAHDLRNPFQSIIGFSEILTDEFDALSEQVKKEMISNVHKSSNTAYNLLETLLQWAQSQTNRIIFNPDNHSLAEVINKTIQLLDIQAKNKNIKILADADENLSAYFDANMVETVLRNLISNAIKFTPVGGTVTIKVNNSNRPNENVLSSNSSSFNSGRKLVCISVTDTGVGMPPEVLEKLFHIEEQQTGVGTEGEKGTGLGLILCKEFYEKNDGFIEVMSKPGKGSTFNLWLPVTSLH